jgi:hypothetical protein
MLREVSPGLNTKMYLYKGMWRLTKKMDPDARKGSASNKSKSAKSAEEQNTE